MENRKRYLEELVGARNSIATKLEEILEIGKNLKLYPKRLPNKNIDVTFKNGEVLALANEKFKELFDEVEFEKIYGVKSDKYREHFKRTYDSCHEAIKSNGNLSLNTAVVGVLGPLINPDMLSNGYLIYHELTYKVESLQELDRDYFKKLEEYKGRYISINDLARTIFSIKEGSQGAGINGDQDEIGEDEVNGMETQTYSRNKILFGPPGAGKSYSINKMLNMVNVKEENITRITFHPEYSYYEFVGQYKPVVGYEKIIGQVRYADRNLVSNEKPFVYYDFVAGPFTKAIINALSLGDKKENKTPENALLIIEEINRGNSSAIFGDVFQLLDRINNVNSQHYGESEYSIEIAPEMKSYIKKQLDWDEDRWNEKFKRGFVIPSNLYIYSTMNTSDQSLYPMDSAFKRRWDMDYIYINYNESKLGNLYLPEPYKDIRWLDFIRAANKRIVNYTGLDDKQIGQWFVGNSLSDSEFLGKVISYLWFDIFRHDPQLIFKNSIKTFDDIRNSYKEGVFKKEFIDLIVGDEEVTDDSE